MAAAVMPDIPPLAAYYARPAVRTRLREYLDPGATGAATAFDLAALSPACARFPTWDTAERVAPADLDRVLARGLDVARSIADTSSLILHFDLDYQNPTEPGEPFLQPVRVFGRLEPVYRTVCDLFDEAGVRRIALVTGRGYNFAAAIPLEAPVVVRLAALAPALPAWYATRAARETPFPRPELTARQARASVGLGMVLEHVAHGILARGSRAAGVPVVVNGTVVGESGPAGRACVSVDLSGGGDPLDVRHLRMAFGGYQLHRLRPDVFGPEAAALPPLVAVPRTDADWQGLVERGRSADAAARAAVGCPTTRMPDCAAGVDRLIDAYEASPLAVAHRRFYAEAAEPPERWTETYDRVNLGHLPPCLRAALRQPNDLLLQPAHLQHLTRGLLAEGWHPRHVAGLVWSRYGRAHDWGDRWTRRMEAATRADYDVRVFAGLIQTGLDAGIDMNCVSAREKGLCTGEACGRDLRVYRDRMREQWQR